MQTLVLPRGIPVKQFDASKRVKIPQLLERFRTNRFSGYLHFDLASQVGIVCFQDGHIIAVLFKSDTERFLGYEALLELFRALQLNNAEIKVYRLESEFSPYLARICRGRVEYEAQLVRFLDTERLLAYLERENFNGCMRIYTPTEATLVFYTDGRAEGFFVDGAGGLRDDLDIEHSLARDPECRYDLIRTPEPEKNAVMPLHGINFEKDWLIVWRELNV
ncbi:MAG: hypothetical protein ABR516_03960 [Desulfuromonadaceae bacterium]|nr:DUF4388 domain-containing protein [Geobacteraceae bacterium]